MITNKPFKTTALALLFLALAANAHGAITGLSDAPLVTSSTTSVLPNVMFVLDDSGSMGWSYMPDTANDFSGNHGYNSNQCNGVYYQPTITYNPPINSTGAPLNATATSFTAAYTDGYNTGAGTTSLANSYYYQYSGAQTTAALKDYYNTSSTFYTECNTSFGVIAGNGSNVFTKISLSSTAAATTATIVVSGTSSTSVSSIKVNGTQEIMSGTAAASATSSTVASNIATQINLCTSAKVGNCSTTGGHGYTASTSGGSTVTLTGLAATATTLIITKGNSGTMTLAPTIFPIADATKLQNFANWYSYYRTRMLMMKTAAGRAFAPIDDRYRVGFATINNNNSPDIVDFAPFDATQKNAWYTKLYAATPGNSTPLREALSNAGRMYAHKLPGNTLNGLTVNDPMQYSCQQNFTILSTDGFWNGPSTYNLAGGAVGQQDGAEPRPYNDGAAQMLTTTQVQQTLTQVFQSTSQLQSRTLQIQSSTSNLQQQTSQLQTRTSRLQSRTSQLQANTNALQTQTSQLQTRTSTLQTQTSQLQGETSTLQGTLSQVLMRCNNTSATCGAAPATGVANANWSVVTSGTCTVATNVQCSVVSGLSATSAVASSCNTAANITGTPGSSAYVTATVTANSSAVIDRIRANGASGSRILSATTVAGTSNNDVASKIAANINACTASATGNCDLSGHSATVLNNVVTISGPSITAGIAIRVSSGSATITTAYTAATSASYTLNNADTNGKIYSACAYSGWSAPTGMPSCSAVAQSGTPNNTTVVTATRNCATVVTSAFADTTADCAVTTTPNGSGNTTQCRYVAPGTTTVNGWSAWTDYASTSCTAAAQSAGPTYTAHPARECQTIVSSAYANTTSNCTVTTTPDTNGRTTQCRYAGWSGFADATSCTAATQSAGPTNYTVHPATQCQYATPGTTTAGWSTWANSTSCTALAQSGASPYTVGTATECQYTTPTAWAGTPSCTAAAQDTTNPYDMTATGGVATECQTVVTSPYANVGSCTVNAVPDASGNTTQCQYTSFTAYANASSCTAVAQSAASPYAVGTATQCRTLYNGSTTDNGWVGASACTPGVTGGQTVTCQTITTGPAAVASCTAAAAAAGNSYTQTTCSPPTTVPGSPTGVASGVASCTPGTGPGPAFITTNCNTVTVGPSGAGTCTPAAADASNNYTATTCASGAGGIADTLADVAEYYYTTDLRTDALGNCTGAVVPPAVVGNTLCTAGAVAAAFADATLTVSAPGSPTSTVVNSITVGSTTITSGATSGSTTASTVASRIAAKITLAGYSATASGSTVTITGPSSAGGSIPVISQSGNLTITATAFTAHAASIDPLNDVPSTGLDAASHQHMTTFTLGLGARGRMVYSPTYLTDTSGDFFSIKNGSTANGTTVCSWQASGACNWPIPTANAIETIDDLWHAAVNGRGNYFSATDPASLATSLSSALAGVSARTGASAAATTSNPNVTSGDNFVFSSTFTTTSWDGELVRQQLDLTTGVTSSTVDWAAEVKLDTKAALTAKAASRTIYTYSASATNHLQAFNETNFGANANFNTPYISTAPDGLTQLLCASASICAPQTIPAAWQASHAYIAGDQYTNSNIFYLVSTGYTSGATFPLAWQAFHAYSAGDQYINSNTLYRVASGYTSGATFGATDTTNSSVFAAATGRAGDNLVNFLRGDRSNEGAETDNTKYYRQRAHILGDIVNAEAVYVKASLFNYNDTNYGAFVTANASRQGIVYTAANDGMLHAIYSADGGAGIVGGDEAWAYIPSLMLPDLYKLADKEYATQHRYFVDGTPVVGDICPVAPAATCTVNIDPVTDWKTILVGGFNKGGRGYYALDITNPASPKALWEFTDTNLGYTYGNPKITKLKDGTWVVLVTSGYNNVPGTPTASYGGDGVGRLYVLNATTGTIIRSISTGVGNTTTPSGLARIAVRVTDSSTDNTALAVYGGDMLGNLWRFDVNNDTGATGYDAQLLTTLIGPTGVAQPITAKPELGDVSGHKVIYVGTGSYLGVGDLGNTNRQSIYAIKDPLTAGTVASTAIYANPRTLTTTFKNQTPTTTTCPVNSPSTICTAGQTVRTTPNLAVNFATDNGWFMDLPDTGERANTDPTLSLGTLGFTTNVPNSNACTVGGYSYRYFMDYRTGGAVSTSTTAVVSTKLGNALATRPVYVRLPNGVVVELTRLSTGTTSTSQVPIGAGGAATRRTSWRELIEE